MIIENMVRIFKYKPGVGKDELVLEDPNPALSPDEVRYHFATTMPACAALVSATVDAPVMEGNNRIIYNLRNSLGTKG
ncbi:PRTRC system protein C [Chitinophaga pollutisoli]|uniref:PRTRC system protein C n=1 Tax=Chitinophaga pollutisoli TaxID=3133966 RepID=A0ABZ2YQB6_9BACT